MIKLQKTHRFIWWQIMNIKHSLNLFLFLDVMPKIPINNIVNSSTADKGNFSVFLCYLDVEKYRIFCYFLISSLFYMGL